MSFLVFLVEFQLYFTEFLKVYLTVLSLKKYLSSKIEKKCSKWVFFFWQIYELPDLGKKTFTTWNVLMSELYLTCINFWISNDHLKRCLEVIRLPSWPKIVKIGVKMHFLRFWPPEKSVFELTANFKFSFFESGSRRVLILPKPVFLFKFSNI